VAARGACAVARTNAADRKPDEPAPGDQEGQSRIAGFLQGLQERGWAVGGNVRIDYRWGGNDAALYRKSAEELIALAPDVLMASGSAALGALHSLTRTVPIVFANVIDPVGAGFVASLAHPGGNITGLSVIDTDISAKQLELLRALSPKLVRVAVLLNPGNSANPLVFKHVEAGASVLGVEVVAVNAANSKDIEAAFAEAARLGAGAVIVAADAFFSEQGPHIADCAARHRLATVSLYRDHGGAIEPGVELVFTNVDDGHRSS
jgi:putative ABC transport system substrate-binding protein